MNFEEEQEEEERTDAQWREKGDGYMNIRVGDTSTGTINLSTFNWFTHGYTDAGMEARGKAESLEEAKREIETRIGMYLLRKAIAVVGRNNIFHLLKKINEE